MTAGRPAGKPRISLKPLWLVLGAALWAGIHTPLGFAATSERVVTDRQTGLAISGFDPVAYFTEASAKLGKSEFEHGFAGATWRFRNEGNRAAFTEDPDVYMPRFGGYDPVAVARGVSVPGHPLFWVIENKKLYFFYDSKARAAFAADPAQFVERAERNWPDVARLLPR
jgi:YHS domain-containing protein